MGSVNRTAQSHGLTCLKSFWKSFPRNGLVALVLAGGAGFSHAATADSLVIGKDKWQNGMSCSYSYSSGAQLLSKVCSDSTGKKQILEIDYSYDSGKRKKEVCVSDDDKLAYQSDYAYSPGGILLSKTTAFANPKRTVITSYGYGEGSKILSEVERYVSGTLVDSLAYVYDGLKLTTKEVYDFDSNPVGEQQQKYDDQGRLSRVLYYSGSPMLLYDQVSYTYLPLSQVTATTGLRTLKPGRPGTAVGRSVLSNGREVQSTEWKATGKVFHHD